MIDDTYDALDRATLATWRLGNVVVWTGIAFLVAVVLHQVADELATRFSPPFGLGGMEVRPQEGFTWQFWAPLYGLRAGVSILIGLAIGTVLGLKVWRRPALLAAVASAGYILITWLAFEISVHASVENGVTSLRAPEHGLPANGIEWSYSVLALIVLAVAPLWARFVAQRRTA